MTTLRGPRSRRKTSSPTQRGFPIGCGVDVVELSRFKQAMRRGGEAFVRRVFTPREQLYARRRRRTTLLHLAGRFAAKEAVIKAVSQVDPTRTLAMKDIEVCNDRLGRPSILLHDGPRRGLAIHISLSHVNSVAVASAIAIHSASRNVSHRNRNAD